MSVSSFKLNVCDFLVLGILVEIVVVKCTRLSWIRMDLIVQSWVALQLFAEFLYKKILALTTKSR